MSGTNLAETDDEFRKRILPRINPEHTATIYIVQIATTTDLDILGKGYGLTREAGPVIDA